MNWYVRIFFCFFASSFSTTWKCKLFWLGILWFLTSWLIRLLQPFMWECTKQTVRKRSHSTLFFFSKAYFSTLDWPSKWATKHYLWWFYPKNRNSGYENLKKRCLLVLLARTCAWKYLIEEYSRLMTELQFNSQGCQLG